MPVGSLLMNGVRLEAGSKRGLPFVTVKPDSLGVHKEDLEDTESEFMGGYLPCLLLPRVAPECNPLGALECLMVKVSTQMLQVRIQPL